MPRDIRPFDIELHFFVISVLFIISDFLWCQKEKYCDFEKLESFAENYLNR